MSAAGRGAPRIDADNYPTPAWCVRRMLEAAPWRDGATWPRSPRIIEPCAGEGAIVRELRKEYTQSSILAIELRECYEPLRGAGADLVSAGDATSPMPWVQLPMDLVITNPPFSLWEKFAAKGIESARWCALLLRIGALAHVHRHKLPTPSIYVLPDRPSFVALWKCAGGGGPSYPHDGCGWQEYHSPDESTRKKRCPVCYGKILRTASDGSEYAWLVWGPEDPQVVVLPETPLIERKGLVKAVA